MLYPIPNNLLVMISFSWLCSVSLMNTVEKKGEWKKYSTFKIVISCEGNFCTDMYFNFHGVSLGWKANLKHKKKHLTVMKKTKKNKTKHKTWTKIDGVNFNKFTFCREFLESLVVMQPNLFALEALVLWPRTITSISFFLVAEAKCYPLAKNSTRHSKTCFCKRYNSTATNRGKSRDKSKDHSQSTW